MPSTKTTKAFINFDEVAASHKKTKTYVVTSRVTGFALGRVYFRPQWRKYVFEPAQNTLYDAVCLSQIAGFIDGLTDSWRSELREERER